MAISHDQFQCTVQGQTKTERDNAAHVRAHSYYGEQPHHLVSVSPAREVRPTDARLGSKTTYEADYLFEDGAERSGRVWGF